MVFGPWPRLFLTLPSRAAVLEKFGSWPRIFVFFGFGLERSVLDSTSEDYTLLNVQNI